MHCVFMLVFVLVIANWCLGISVYVLFYLSDYLPRLIKVSHVNIWAQAANCENGEITT